LTNSPFSDTRSRVVEAKVRITNRLGIHARPATLLVRAAQKFESRITLIKDDMEADGKSIMDIMILAAEPDSCITIRADGEDEDEAVQALKRIVEDKFYED
jgi:phosphocarrier protein HPr